MRMYILSIPISNYDKALKFYTEILGFVKKRDSEMAHGIRFITLVSPEDPNGPELLLEPNAKYHGIKALRKALAEDGIPIASFAVQDVQKEYERLNGLGVKFTQKPMSAGGWTSAVFDDTNGNLIEIAEVPAT
ncbi:MAG: VOC family protein [Anaerolineales bacterium]|nr:VOC family protein [Anaerolineales bacterium]MCW5855594.1 VOC family protein [Anaerolineales bacterium]